MLAARLAGLVVAAALLAGCGSDAREGVESYIREVNTLQQELLIPLTQASAAYRNFTTSEEELVKLRPKLVAAERSMRRLDSRLSELEPPREARKLHGLLRKLTRAQVELADELERSSVYLPGYTSALRPLGEAENRLRRELREARTAAKQAKAIRRFENAVETALEKLGRLDVPAVMSGTHDTQAEALEGLRKSAGDLAAALERGGRAKDIPRLVQRLVNAPLAARSLASQRTRIATVKSYNARIERVEELAQKVERERLRLQQTVR